MSEPNHAVVTETGRNKRLADVLPPEFLNGGYENSPAMKYVFIDVVASYHSNDRPWPGDHRHVSVWHVLANGKAVGWNENPQRGWSFPVMTYHEPSPEFATMHFDNTLHRDCYRVLMNYGFHAVITSDLIVGHEYSHPEKPVRVVLKNVDGDLEYYCLKPNGKTYDKLAFTIGEQEWINDTTDVSESLRRELNILIRVRPNYMILQD